MAAKEKVRRKYPEAWAYQWHREWTVYASKNGPLAGINLGSGRTARAAWLDAAQRFAADRKEPTP